MDSNKYYFDEDFQAKEKFNETLTRGQAINELYSLVLKYKFEEEDINSVREITKLIRKL